jgi:Ni/Co efflux regulator RcnB
MNKKLLILLILVLFIFASVAAQELDASAGGHGGQDHGGNGHGGDDHRGNDHGGNGHGGNDHGGNDHGHDHDDDRDHDRRCPQCRCGDDGWENNRDGRRCKKCKHCEPCRRCNCGDNGWDEYRRCKKCRCCDNHHREVNDIAEVETITEVAKEVESVSLADSKSTSEVQNADNIPDQLSRDVDQDRDRCPTCQCGDDGWDDRRRCKKCKRCRCCPDGWTRRRGSCFRKFSDNEGFEEAKRRCSNQRHRGERGNLATINDRDENDFINRNFRGEFWVGLRRRRGDRFEWESGSNDNFRNFERGEPNRGDDCVCMGRNNNGKWKGGKCNERKDFLCEVRNSCRDNHDFYDN